jgi:Domain of unknown function (DUF5658)
MFRAALALAFGFVVSGVTPALAADGGAEQAAFTMSAAAVPALATDVDWSLAPMRMGAGTAHRGVLLPTLYVSLAALNAFDAMTTFKALGSGSATEANPMMAGVVGHSAALWAVKGGATAASILLAERMWRTHNRVAAVATMVVTNGMMVAVAANNARVAVR